MSWKKVGERYVWTNDNPYKIQNNSAGIIRKPTDIIKDGVCIVCHMPMQKRKANHAICSNKCRTRLDNIRKSEKSKARQRLKRLKLFK